MSERWPGGIVRATPVTPTGPLQNGTAPGMWTLDQANYWIKQGLWPTAGNFLAVEDVFSTWLYTGTGAAQTITNGIDLAGKGGLVWIKSRSAATNNFLFDTSRGVNVEINSNTTDANATLANSLTAFNSNGFSISSATGIGVNAATYASWTFREAPKFFDVVTYTGNGANRNIAHNLGVAPGCIIVKRTDAAANWQVYHRSNANTEYMVLNSSAAKATGTTRWNSTTPTATEFTVGTDTTVNANGGTYVAYLFAHDTTTDGIIQCGSFTTDGSGNFANQNLGWEPQWIMYKRSDVAEDWEMVDNMRGLPVSTAPKQLRANTSGAEFDGYIISLTPTGFQCTANQLSPSATYIYIAIRRGPMRIPTVGTSVFSPNLTTANNPFTTNFPVDFALFNPDRAAASHKEAFDRLRGQTQRLITNLTNAESTTAAYPIFDNNTGLGLTGFSVGVSGVNWSFRRAPSFMDVVCYTGTGSAGVRAIPHNLGVAPELIISKFRNKAGENWQVYASPLGATKYLYLNTTAAAATYNMWGNTSPTSTNFYVQTDYTNQSGYNFVTYLFASCPGVSKVGSYTGTGALQTINCGFTTGARFVLIKRTDSTGDWYVWDSARGITSGNDPYLLLNSTAAEVTGTNYVDTDTTGFQVTAAAPAGINANGGSYIFLAIA